MTIGDTVVVIKKYSAAVPGMVGVIVGPRSFPISGEELVLCRFPGWTKGHSGWNVDENGKPYMGKEIYYLPANCIIERNKLIEAQHTWEALKMIVSSPCDGA
jgi:hypothetical protein